MKYEVRIMKVDKIQFFTDLNAWKESHKLVLFVYKLTHEFPKDEKYGLVAQMRRASVSITSNLAEGFSRYSYADKSHFYSMALGSNTELQNQFLVSRDLNYIDEKRFLDAHLLCIISNKLINGLIKQSRVIHNS